jgi:hypothetical protein
MQPECNGFARIRDRKQVRRTVVRHARDQRVDPASLQVPESKGVSLDDAVSVPDRLLVDDGLVHAAGDDEKLANFLQSFSGLQFLTSDRNILLC